MNKIEIGSFISGKYKCGSICGIVSKIGKNKVQIQVYQQHYKEFTKTDRLVDVTVSRIYGVGTLENAYDL